MLAPRLIPFLLIRGRGLVKTVKFANEKYVGDPLNAVRIFNEKKVDEIVVVDIDATVNGQEPDYKLIENLAAECRMPLCYGGGITSSEQATHILSLGVEKVSLSSQAIIQPNLVKTLSNKVGSQSVVVTLDVKKKMFGGYEVYTHNGTQGTNQNPIDLAIKYQTLGAGEIVINSIDNDGRMGGYDLKMISSIKEKLTIPVTAIGGCGSMSDVASLVQQEGIIGAGAGSMFVFKGKYRAVLITYPNEDKKLSVLNSYKPNHVITELK